MIQNNTLENLSAERLQHKSVLWSIYHHKITIEKAYMMRLITDQELIDLTNARIAGLI
jgi:hypothetical protein